MQLVDKHKLYRVFYFLPKAIKKKKIPSNEVFPLLFIT